MKVEKSLENVEHFLTIFAKFEFITMQRLESQNLMEKSLEKLPKDQGSRIKDQGSGGLVKTL